KDFQFLVFGDPQPYNKTELEYFDKGFTQEAKSVDGISFGITLGEIVGDDLSLHAEYLKVMKKVEKPWYAVLGNHDMNFDVKDDQYSDESFEATFGPATYAFNYGDVHFIVMDNILYPDPRDNSGYWGGLRADQLRFIENDLKHVSKDKLVVLFMHIPIFEEGGDSYRDEGRRKLLELIAPFKNSVSFSAHTHYQCHTFFGKADGYNHDKLHHHHNIGTPSGDWYSGRLNKMGVPDSKMRDGTPKGYVIVNISGSSYTSKYRVAGKDTNYQMEVYNPKVVKKDQRTSAGIFVNFFMGSKNDKVNYRIDNSTWRAMQNVTAFDPSYMKELFNWDDSESLVIGKRPSNPELTNHLWRAGIPTNFSVGEHVIEIEATDIFGQVFTAKSIYRIEE
ncbi:MAG TPA: calcineurin-like phosphoesterase C-terminal domain-containing protein, partial [Saprospiraceae bacterium]|nr:calcineurin-like phosphoesterase C-terminal domain-containing protein [Saprospiraceae bacterium]